MISYIKGPLVEVGEDRIVIEAGCIGYDIYVPLSLLEKLPSIGEDVLIYTYFQVREDAVNLYGFLCRRDLEMFRQLIGVNGIGPKGALGILSAMSPDDLRLAIFTGDAKAISKAPGVGIKTAQRVILDLKDRISAEEVIPQVGEARSNTGGSPAGQEAIDALVALGYSQTEAARAVGKVSVAETMTGEDVLKASLKHLAF